ncbi:cytochrome P450 7B1 [Protopterus annectens]|uniref:cytochrome P450 7B1 n=1 Tax=Protopterus annectens TaxID=7888 RepID=UPI001CFBDA16|nr:cytochrome P450 7B1 [Protopterus annectens]
MEIYPMFADFFQVLLFIFLAPVLFFIFSRRIRKPGEPPLEQGWIPYLGKALEFHKDAYKFLQAQQKKHGNIFTVHIAGRYITYIMDPLQYGFIIRQGKQLDFQDFALSMASRTFAYPPMIETKFPGLSEKVHKAYQHLQGDSLNKLTESMNKNLQLVLCEKSIQETVDWRTEKLYSFCNRVMFEASFLSVYGKCQDGQRHSFIDRLKEDFNTFDKMFPYLVANVPIELLGATKKIRKDIINIFLCKNVMKWHETSDVVRCRRDLFEEYELRDQEKAAHHFAFLWAAMGNTLPATFWAMYYLVRNPEALAVVRDEVDHVLQSTHQEIGLGCNILLTREQLDSLVYLGSAIHESLRMCSASMNIRVVQEDFTLRLEGDEAISLRKKDWVALYPQSLHMDPDVYEDPEIYKFDRFVENGKEKTTFYKNGKKLRYYLMPFGSGASMCPGRFFAVNEMKQFLFFMITHFDMKLKESETRVGLEYSRSGLGILFPDSDVDFQYRRRKP